MNDQSQALLRKVDPTPSNTEDPACSRREQHSNNEENNRMHAHNATGSSILGSRRVINTNGGAL